MKNEKYIRNYQSWVQGMFKKHKSVVIGSTKLGIKLKIENI